MILYVNLRECATSNLLLYVKLKHNQISERLPAQQAGAGREDAKKD